MARNFFDNLPSTRTPVEAGRMNGLLDGDEAMGNIVVDSVRGKNLFNENVVLLNYELVGSTGAVSPNNGWYVSDYIEVEPNITYYLTKGNSGGSNCFYDSNKVFISAINSTPNGQITVPNNDNIKYMRFNGVITQLNGVQFEKGTTSTLYSQYQGLGYVRGSNANGEYIKYDDGTLICHMTVDKSGYVTTSANYTEVQGIKWYRSNMPDINFPMSFVDRTYQVHIIPYMEGQAGSRLMIPKVASKTVSKTIVQFISVEDFTSSGTAYTNLTSVDVIAIGRWK